MSIEDEILTIIIAKQLELTTKGFTEDQASAAIKRSRKWAESIARRVDASIREQAFLDLFTDSLNEAESWLSKVKSSRDAWEEGLANRGTPVGPMTKEAYDNWTK